VTGTKLVLPPRVCVRDGCSTVLERRPAESPTNWRRRVYCSAKCQRPVGRRTAPSPAVVMVPAALLSVDDRDQTWRDESACKSADPNLFNPVGQRELRGYERCRATADEFCHVCPVVASCFAQAVVGKEHGVWAAHLFRAGQPEPLLADGLPIEAAS
jgi:hypothetical protein